MAARALRGGSWNNNSENASAAYRNRNHPDNRNNNNGFRVVCVPYIFLGCTYPALQVDQGLPVEGCDETMAPGYPVRTIAIVGHIHCG